MLNNNELCQLSYPKSIILKDVEILAEIKHQKQMLRKRGKRFISWELRIHEDQKIQLVIIHKDGFYTVAL